jgi:hypothetical protein
LFFCPQPNFQVNSDFLSARKMASRSSLTMWNVLSFILFSVGVAPALLISNFFCSRDYTSCHHVIFFSLFQTPRSCQINCRWWKYRNKKRMLCYSAHSRYYLTSRSIPCEAISIALLYSTYCGWCKPVDQTSTRLKIVAEKSNKKNPLLLLLPTRWKRRRLCHGRNGIYKSSCVCVPPDSLATLQDVSFSSSLPNLT